MSLFFWRHIQVSSFLLDTAVQLFGYIFFQMMGWERKPQLLVSLETMVTLLGDNSWGKEIICRDLFVSDVHTMCVEYCPVSHADLFTGLL